MTTLLLTTVARALRVSASHAGLAIALIVTTAAAGSVAGTVLSTVSPSCADAATVAGQVNVGLVIDFGSLPGAPGGAARRECVAVPDRANGFQVLQARGHAIRVDSSGLLCGIDGYPSGDECGVRTATGYRYWAYFHGDGGGGWSYSAIGPGGYRVKAGAVEGWHFVEGTGMPNDPPPAGSSDSVRLCGSVPPPTTATTSPPPVPTTTAPPPVTAPGQTTVPPGGSAGGGGGGAAPTSSTTAGPPATDALGQPLGTAPGAGEAPGGPVGDPSGTAPDGTAADGAAPAGSVPGGTLTPGGEVPAAGGFDDAAPPVSTPASGEGTPSGSAPWLGLLLVVAVGAVAGWRFKARDPG